MKVCITPRCQKKRAKGRNYCHSCRKRRYAEKYPIKNAYQTLRQNAKRRGKEFSLTLEEFTEFATETKLFLGRGKTATSWHIDRIDDSKGYTRDNLQVLTNSENVTKENLRRKKEKVLYYDYQLRIGYYKETNIQPNDEIEDAPF